jgi:hypothetical protein
MIKRAEIITILAGLLFVYITDSARAVITDVEITPDEPTTEDIITVVTYGTESSYPVWKIGYVVNITGSVIELDLTLEKGPFFMITDWTYPVDIGRLPAGTYDLTVRTTVNSVLTDTYFKTFQVVPAPPMTLDGSGTQQDPWLIQSLDDFNEFAAIKYYWDDYTRLETDVNLAGIVYTNTVIASDTDNSNYTFEGTAFTGVFDGNNHKIIGLTIDKAGAGYNYMGLFGYIDEGEVKNLGLEGVSIRCDDGVVGGLVGWNQNSSILNCYSNGDVNGIKNVVGGLVGFNGLGSISNCYSVGDVNGVDYVGGLVGVNWGSVSNCYSTGDVDGTFNVGGLVGENGYSYPNSSYCYVGVITNSYWDAETSGEPNMCGSQSACSSGCDPNCGKTTAEMHKQSTFTNWDFINVWNIGENQTYPHLRTYLAGDINKDGIVNFLDVAITANQWMEEQ